MTEALSFGSRVMNELFHYCSTETFFSIVQSGEIRLSSMAQSNDSMEGRVVEQILQDFIVSGTVAGEFGMEFVQFVGDEMSQLRQSMEGLGFSLSEQGDLLSQWRGYAADATGVSIGFSRESLQSIASDSSAGVTLRQVEYASKAQYALVTPIFEEVRRRFLEESRRSARDCIYSRLVPLLYVLKTEAFAEEREWRLLADLHAGGPRVHRRYRATNNQLVPLYF